MNQKNPAKENIVTVVFAVLIFVGVRFLRIPYPFSSGEQFLHLGYVFVALAVLNVDMVKAAAAALGGFILNSVLGGDFAAIPGILFCTIVSCLATGTVYGIWMDQDNMTPKEERVVMLKSVLLYGALSLLVDRAWTSWSLMHTGTKTGTAAVASICSAPPVILNAVITVIGAAVLCLPVTAVCRRIVKE